MKRDDFLKRLTLGLGAIAVTPTVLSAKEVPAVASAPISVAIDLNTISNISMAGHKITPVEIVDIWKQTGMLLYRGYAGNAPIVMQGEIKAIDISKQK